MVPPAPIAGAMLMPGRCDPHAPGKNGAVEPELGGHGSVVPAFGSDANVPGQDIELPGGAFGTSVAYVTFVAVSLGVIFTSHAFATSFEFHGLPPVTLSWTTL